MPSPEDLSRADLTGAGGCLTMCPTGQCGLINDNCGSKLDCTNNCTMGTTCGGGGQGGLCGCPTETFCLGRNCGTIPNGCGGIALCGTSCASGQTCGGGGANICGPNSCTPMKTVNCPSPPSCGYVSDGCSGVVICKCPANKTCGANGMCP
jgi:hypothetical protein